MILGASYSQLPLYEAAERLGIKTIAARKYVHRYF